MYDYYGYGSSCVVAMVIGVVLRDYHSNGGSNVVAMVMKVVVWLL